LSSWLSNPKRNVAISTGVFCLIGMVVPWAAQPWLTWGVAGLVAGLIGLPAIRKEKRTFWRMLALPCGEALVGGLGAYCVFLFIR
jgi:hypothetical protein